MLRFEGFSGFSVSFSPFPENLLGVACSQHYGIVGNGRLFVVSPPLPGAAAAAPLPVVAAFDTQDAMLDCAWSETNRAHIVTACGDGVVRMFDLGAPGGRPIRAFSGHSREVNGVHWNLVHKQTFASASWDDCVKVWSPERPAALTTFHEHRNCAYQSIWSPYNADAIASCGGEGTVKLWDARAPPGSGSVATIAGHAGEVLSVDWNKYNEHIIASGSVDKTIRVWDIRATQREVACLVGHQFAVRRVRWSPFAEQLIASASYDLTARIWDTRQPSAPLDVFDRHTEFVVGVDWSLNVEHQLATCGWDEMAFVFVPRPLAAALR